MFWKKLNFSWTRWLDLRCTHSCAVMKFVSHFIRISCVGVWPFNFRAWDYFAITLLLKWLPVSLTYFSVLEVFRGWWWHQLRWRHSRGSLSNTSKWAARNYNHSCSVWKIFILVHQVLLMYFPLPCFFQSSCTGHRSFTSIQIGKRGIILKSLFTSLSWLLFVAPSLKLYQYYDRWVQHNIDMAIYLAVKFF